MGHGQRMGHTSLAYLKRDMCMGNGGLWASCNNGHLGLINYVESQTLVCH
jgi:hypothetical protein